MTETFYLYLPGIVAASKAAGQHTIAGQLLAKAQVKSTALGLDRLLGQMIGHTGTGAFPYARLMAAGAGLTEPCSADDWMLAEHTVLQAGPMGLTLSHLDDGLSSATCQTLMQQLQPLFDAFGATLITQPERSFLKLTKIPDMTTNTIYDVVMKDLKHRLPSGPDGKAWQRLMTECQMVLQTVAQTHRIGACNNLWFWGLGQQSEPITPPFQSIYGEHHLTQGIASHLGVKHRHPFEASQHGQACALLSFQLLACLGTAAQVACYEAIEKNWLQPLWTALAEGKLQKCIIYTHEGYEITYQPKQRYYFWRRNAYDTHSNH